jgi:AraC-like DNA-binding protein
MSEASSEREQLLQDLRTHQLELELQNEELRSSQVALECSKKEY